MTVSHTGLARLRRARDEERGSMPMVMLVLLLSVTLSALMVPTFLQANNSTRSDVARVRALHAAETGLQVALGQVRAAHADGSTSGINSSLPCTGALTGSVAAGSAAYSVTAAYFDTDPRGQTSAWRTSNAIGCSSLPSHTPSFVSFSATGTDTSSYGSTATRVLDATYVLRTNNQNIPGGLIQNYNDGAATYRNVCFDAGSPTPSTGTVLTVQTCQYNVPDQQKFSYRNNLTLVLNSSLAGGGSGLCLQASSVATGATITFQPCITDPATLYLQQWSFNDGALFQAANSSGALISYCFNIATLDTVGSNVVLGPCSGTSRQVAWIPSPAAGAGMAGPNTNQLINFKQFGRCLDQTNWDLSKTLIAYPCKQTPTGTPGWNQRFSYSFASKILSLDAYSSNGPVENPNRPYCLVNPPTGATGANLRVGVAPCAYPTPTNEQWIAHLDPHDAYRDKYTYADASGTRCLEPSPTDFFITAASGNGANNISWVVVAPCDGSLLQKWNGDPNILLGSPLKDANER